MAAMKQVRRGRAGIAHNGARAREARGTREGPTSVSFQKARFYAIIGKARLATTWPDCSSTLSHAAREAGERRDG